MATQRPVIEDGVFHRPIPVGDTIDPAWLPAATPFADRLATVTGSYSVGATDTVVSVNNGGAAVTITLPAAAANLNRRIHVRRHDDLSTGTVNVNVSGGGPLQDRHKTSVVTTTIPNILNREEGVWLSDGTIWLLLFGL